MLNEEYIPEAKNHVDKINVNAELRSVRVKNLNKLIIGHLNINSLRNKFELLMHQIKDNIDTLKKQTPNMSILQFQNVKAKQDLSKTVYFVDVISTLFN